MKRRIAVLVAVLLLLGVGQAIAQSGPQAGPPVFLEDLAALLEGGEFTDAEIRALLAEARTMNWDRAGEADPEAVGLALQLTARERMTARERAELAHELAEACREMEREGYRRQVVARAAIEGTRGAMNEIREQQRLGENTEVGDRIRLMVRDRIVAAVREHAERENLGQAEQARNGEAGDGTGSGSGSRGPGAGPDGRGR